MVVNVMTKHKQKAENMKTHTKLLKNKNKHAE